MIVKSKAFQEAANTILSAIAIDSKNITNIELFADGNILYLNVSNREYFVSVSFPLENEEHFRAVVNASLFLTLISGITTEEFEFQVKPNMVVIKAGKSTYKAPLIFEKDELIKIPAIYLKNKTVEMTIPQDILDSILKVNSREVAKTKTGIDVTELQRLYYIDENGCFTFTNGACLNAFKLAKPVKLLLNDNIVKLFKLFKEDVYFSFGYDSLPDGSLQSKAIFETSSVYVAALITCDDILISKVQGPCIVTKKFIEEAYSNQLVVSSTDLAAAVNRMLSFAKNSGEDVKIKWNTQVNLTDSEFIITDRLGNVETVAIENAAAITPDYQFTVNLVDLKFILDSCKNEHLTISFGNHRSIIIARGNISNLIPEGKSDTL